MTRTVTYDETQWKLVPIEPTEEMIGADIEPLYGMDMALAYKTMLNYAPPYPESNFVESLDSWMPASERHPCCANIFLAYEEASDAIYISSVMTTEITHWMPIPSAPKEPE